MSNILILYLNLGPRVLHSVARGADVGAVSEEGSSVLHYLAVSQTPEALDVVKLLFETGAEILDINAVDWDGYTALMRS